MISFEWLKFKNYTLWYFRKNAPEIIGHVFFIMLMLYKNFKSNWGGVDAKKIKMQVTLHYHKKCNIFCYLSNIFFQVDIIFKDVSKLGFQCTKIIWKT